MYTYYISPAFINPIVILANWVAPTHSRRPGRSDPTRTATKDGMSPSVVATSATKRSRAWVDPPTKMAGKWSATIYGGIVRDTNGIHLYIYIYNMHM